ncbi:NUDIX domain-containing protein [Nocardioides mangrovicus]|uniref:NUDIX domain-containing protein n=1 Tax=Nocardioides mangrovicus TaxID=2478913 RepID=A0A3L8P5C5_9ACTN|nr:NUDIX domain-containing protein [Nocardioides mangrovicus]RLV50570.1 NUDIX domain-containing protein [Nocardioides mangrovicus]
MEPFPAYPHEVLGIVLSVREPGLSVLLWRRRSDPDAGRWALPGGGIGPRQRLREAITEHLGAKVDVREVAWLEQVATHSRVDRDPRARVLATGYLAIVPPDAEPALPDDTAWHPVADLPPLAFDHVDFISAASERLRAKLSYTNIGFALAPREFTIQRLREVVSAALGYDVGATNLQRVSTRRGLIEPTGEHSAPGPDGGRPAALYRFRSRVLEITDPFAVLRPPERR